MVILEIDPPYRVTLPCHLPLTEHDREHGLQAARGERLLLKLKATCDSGSSYLSCKRLNQAGSTLGQPRVNWGSTWSQAGSDLESIWGQPGSTWGQPGINLRSTWVNMRSTRGQLGVNLGSTCGQLGVNPGSTWGQTMVNLGSICIPPPGESAADSTSYAITRCSSPMV
jgi:hypothetical protein